MKRFIALLLTLCLLLPLIAALPIEIAAATVPVLPITLTDGFPAVKADVGETVNLSLYNVTADDGSVLRADQISWSSDELTVTGGKITPTAKGVYRLTATAGTATKTVYLLVKAPSETEYVLFEEDFEGVSSFDQLLTAGYTTPQKPAPATVTVADGKLVLSAQSNADAHLRVLFPAWLGDFGDYRIEVNAAMTARMVDSNWMGIMYRVQNDGKPYYQNTFRAVTTAANGTEVAVRNVNDKWNVVYTKAYTSSINDGKSTPAYHDFTAEVFGDYVSSFIDGTAVATDFYLPDLDRGRVGLQVRAAELTVESVRIVIPAEQEIVRVDDPASDVVNAPSIITEITDAATLTALTSGGTLPATAILHLNRDLNVTTPAGTVLCTLENALALLQGKVIPAFYVSNATTADALGAWLAAQGLKDCFIVAKDANFIQRVRNLAPICRGVLDLADLSPNTDPSTLRALVNGCGARVALLPASYATRANVSVLHGLLIAVWMREAADTDVARVAAVTSGVSGVVTADPAALAACYTDYFMPSTLTTSPGMIGHRGSPVYAQENTVESAVLAVELGATLIEADFYLTKDNVVVGMHDATIDGTTNGSGKVKDFTYAELCGYMVNDNASVAPKPIPTLNEYCAALKGKDARLLIEIKDGDTAICQYILDIIDQYDMRDQVNLISFNAGILQKFKELCPELSVGFLYSGLSGNYASIEADPEGAVAEILGFVQEYDSTFNPDYSKIGPNLVAAAKHRGVLILPWTINNRTAFDKLFLMGTHAYTTDYTAWASDYIQDLYTTQKTYITNTVGGDIPLALHAKAYNGAVSTPANATLTVVEKSGSLTCDFEGGILRTSGTGSATCLLSVSFFTASGTMYSKCTEPFTVTVDTDYVPPVSAENGHFILGSGAPVGTAEQGLLYLDLTCGDVYRYDGGWVLQGSLKAEAPTVEIVDGYWYVNGTSTGVRAEGKDGAAGTLAATLTIGPNGNWFIDGADSGVPAQGPKGDQGEPGEKGDTGIQGIQGEKGDKGDTGAIGLPGKKGDPGEDGIDGKDGVNGKDATADTAALSAATTTATVAVVIAAVLLTGNIAALILFLIKRRKQF